MIQYLRHFTNAQQNVFSKYLIIIFYFLGVAGAVLPPHVFSSCVQLLHFLHELHCGASVLQVFSLRTDFFEYILFCPSKLA